jgi:nucleoporin NUP82
VCSSPPNKGRISILLHTWKMPRILSYTPSWLTRPSPGFQIFEGTPKIPTTAGARNTSSLPSGPLRTIACRGTQIFVAIGKEIRWSDLVLLKDYETERAARSRKETPLSDTGYPQSMFRVSTRFSICLVDGTDRSDQKLKTSLPGPIIQLRISTLGDYMAIVTNHTVHVAILPDSYELDPDAFQLKTFQLGPTVHVSETSPVVTALWHPLGELGRCLVTVTADAVVRLWEINKDNRDSFGDPALTLDLKKLGNAEFDGEDLEDPGFGFKAFGPDAIALETAGAAFGGLGQKRESPWSAMTLWLATTGGDVYALCPLLPAKWQAYPGLIDTLRKHSAVRTKEARDFPNKFTKDGDNLRMQTKWIEELMEQEPFLISTTLEGGQVMIYSRPNHPRPAPMLQGPFDHMLDEVDNISDLVVRNIRVGDEELEFETGEVLDDHEEDESDPLGATLVCLVTKPGKLHILLDLEGVEGQWLPSITPQNTPKKNSISPSAQKDDIPCLFPLESISLPAGTDQNLRTNFSPSFTADVQSPYAFFVTHSSGVSYFSMDKWAERLKDQLEDPVDAGSEIRLDTAIQTTKTVVEHLIRVEKDQNRTRSPIIPTCAVILDSDIGYFAMTSVDGLPNAVSLNTHYQQDVLRMSHGADEARQPKSQSPESDFIPEPRQSYQADNRFFEQSLAVAFAKNPCLRRPYYPLKENIRLSEATLDIMIQAHAIFGSEAKELGEGVARLFRACSRMQNEYKDQIQQIRHVATQVDGITGDDEEAYEADGREKGRARIEQRLDLVKQRQHKIDEKYKRIRKRLALLNERQMSDKEKTFAAEVDALAQSLKNRSSGDQGHRWKRIDEVKQLSAKLIERGKEVSPQQEALERSTMNGSTRRSVPTAFRKAKMDQVMELLDRETAMVESATDRLQRLGMDV